MTPGDRVTVAQELDIVTVQHSVARVARQAGLTGFAITRLVTAASELARNLIVHAGGGRAEIAVVEESGRSGVRVVVSDDGPGIADVAAAMRDGYTTGGGLGLGLPGAKRLVDTFSLRSHPGAGTEVTITMWRR